jgi:fructose-1,6-bisphosphatase/inositol monophosphatase family enzyme
MAKELEVAVEAARAAGELLRGRFGAKQTVRYKGEVDIVTEVDERAERVIREILLSAFPTYGILAEEGGELSGEDDACWVVDPLDCRSSRYRSPLRGEARRSWG